VTPDLPGARPPSAYRAVIFDLGGVVMPSPMESFRAYERRKGLPHRFISEVVVNGGEHGAWSQLERGELSLDEFADAFDAECAAAGGRIVTRELLAELATGAGPRAPMVTAIGAIRDRGLRTAALTNNWRAPDDTGDLDRRSSTSSSSRRSRGCASPTSGSTSSPCRVSRSPRTRRCSSTTSGRT
jgi:FMN phosphatase YigB (HAD superfamily)